MSLYLYVFVPHIVSLDHCIKSISIKAYLPASGNLAMKIELSSLRLVFYFPFSILPSTFTISQSRSPSKSTSHPHIRRSLDLMIRRVRRTLIHNTARPSAHTSKKTPQNHQ